MKATTKQRISSSRDARRSWKTWIGDHLEEVGAGGNGWVTETMSTRGSSEIATGRAGNKEAVEREETVFMSAGLREGSDGEIKLGSDQESFWFLSETSGWVGAEVASAGTRPVETAESRPAQVDSGKEKTTKLDEVATEPNNYGVTRRTVSTTTATSTAVKHSWTR